MSSLETCMTGDCAESAATASKSSASARAKSSFRAAICDAPSQLIANLAAYRLIVVHMECDKQATVFDVCLSKQVRPALP